MKKVLLICCLLAATYDFVPAQTATASKTEFSSKVSQLNALLKQGKKEEAKLAWNDVHKQMMAQLTAIKHKISDAGSDAEKEHFSKVAKDQFDIYSAVLQLREDMVQNKAAIGKKLNQFGENLL